jgi:hypothetical protein
MMAITNYAELQAAISDYMARNDISGKASEFIALAEARLNRTLDAIPSTAQLTGTSGENFVDITSLNIVEPISLYVSGISQEYVVVPRAQGTFAYMELTGTPSQWAAERVVEAGTEKTYLRFDRSQDEAYEYRFTYTGRFVLSDAAPTNNFLTNFPDVYLAASIVWGCLYTKSVKDGTMWKTVLEEGLQEARDNYAQNQRGTLMIDPMLRRNPRYSLDLDIVA